MAIDNGFPRPWRLNESVGGKWYMYDADNDIIIVPNISSTNRSPKEMKAMYRLIVQAVNAQFTEALEKL
jgi:hypothetical protein